MSLEPVLARIAQIGSAFADPMTLEGGDVANAGETPPASAKPSSFASVLGSVMAPEAQATNDLLGASAGSGDMSAVSSGQSALEGVLAEVSGTASPLSAAAPQSTASPGGNEAIAQIADTQVGQGEQPPGSNDGPAIAAYRSAVAGAQPGEPWCAQFASWVARQAGTPIGAGGQGASAVSELWSWAQQNGRAIVNGPGVVPQPGDLICFGDAHVGIVTAVAPNGEIDTVEGNFDNKVSRNVRGPGEATGYIDTRGFA